MADEVEGPASPPDETHAAEGQKNCDLKVQKLREAHPNNASSSPTISFCDTYTDPDGIKITLLKDQRNSSVYSNVTVRFTYPVIFS